ncbi:MAG: GNAT family N-acetyltransferase [Candidatus Micrarchaeota archaeon]
MKIKIRRALTKDLPSILSMWRALMRFHKTLFPEHFKTKRDALARYKTFLKKRLKAKNAAVFVAEANGQIIGHIMVSRNKLPPVYSAREAYVDELFVKPNYRGKGVATALLQQAQKWAKEKKYNVIAISVNIKNTRAKKLYENFRFKPFNLALKKKI